MILSHNGIPKNALLRTVWSHYKSAERRINTAQNKDLIQVPSVYFPHSGFTGALWIELQPRKLDQINTGGRGGTYRTTDVGTTYRFLAPVDGILEAHNHDWQVYESMQAKLLKLFSDLEIGISKAGQSFAVLKEEFGKSLRGLVEGKIPSGKSLTDAVLKSVSYDVPKRKIDSPLAYETSARREFLFTFPLVSEGLKTDLVDIVKQIQQKAAPTRSGNSINIEWPWVWSIQSNPPGVLDVDLAACTSVQVSWNEPYLSGVPQRCDLTLGFRDISPLFAETIVFGSLVNINPDQKPQESYSTLLTNKGTLPKEIKGVIENVREKLGGPKTNTPINP
jgi:hypothetical protein